MWYSPKPHCNFICTVFVYEGVFVSPELKQELLSSTLSNSMKEAEMTEAEKTGCSLICFTL